MVKKEHNALRIPYAQSVYDSIETQKVLRVFNEKRTMMGCETVEFEKKVTKQFGKRYGIMVNSGSSANLLAVELLNMPEGSEVITPLLTFATTVAPLIQKKLVPVFTDVMIGSYQINISQIEKLISKKTKAIMVPLLLGNVPDMRQLKQLCKKYNLFFIEDSCDTFGATWDGAPSGTYSDITTTSFYGSHIITAGGGGGMIMVSRKDFANRALVLRGWGRDSSLFNESESLIKRFKTKLGEIPYDAKFIFSQIGYNFLPLEISSAFGNGQLLKLSKFRKTREHNFKELHEFFSSYEHVFILPRQDKSVQTQWLAFPLHIKIDAPFTRLQIVTYLETNNIQTRPIFTGNILKQPGFKNIPHRIIKAGCPVTDEIMRQGFVIGCHHGLEKKHIIRIKEVFDIFLKKYSKI